VSIPVDAATVAAMSDAELSEAVAREVFGAEIREWPVRPIEPAKPFACYMGAPSGCLFLWRLEDPCFLPFTPALAASYDAVLERMRQRWSAASVLHAQRPRWILEELHDGKWNVGAVRVGWAGVIASALGRAVFECALLAVREMSTRDAEPAR
jgi:hypothetical protein